MRNIWIIGSVSRLNFSNKSQKKSRLFRYSRDLARISARSIDLDMNEETEMTYIVYVISPQILECRNGHILLLPIRFDCVIHKIVYMYAIISISFNVVNQILNRRIVYLGEFHIMSFLARIVLYINMTMFLYKYFMNGPRVLLQKYLH